MVRPADIYVLFGLLANELDAPRAEWQFRELASRLRVSHPFIQRALARAGNAGLYDRARRNVNIPHFSEFAVHALRFVAPVELGAPTPGVPTAWAAKPLVDAISTSSDEILPVWPSHDGEVRGQALAPLHENAVDACRGWPSLHQLLAIADTLRAGGSRERRVAADLLDQRLSAIARSR